jgi:hypothetical protein
LDRTKKKTTSKEKVIPMDRYVAQQHLAIRKGMVSSKADPLSAS